MEDLHNHLANLSLNDLGLGNKYADEVFEVDRTTMISNLKKLLHRCFLNNFKDIQLPNMRKEHGVAFPLETRRFAHIKSSTSTIYEEAAYRFAALVQILVATLQAQSRKDLLLLRSIREVYYEYNNMHAPNNLYLCMPKLIKRVDELSCLFSCPRTSLGLTAESGNSGFIGRVILVRKSVATDAEISEDASILDNVHTINFSSVIRVERGLVPPLFILIVEKMSLLRNLISTKFHLFYPCIIVSGGGEPSIECRQFVRLLCDTFEVPSFFLGDCNPYGYEIFRTYKYGSMKLAHMSKNLVLPNLKFVGLSYADIPRQSQKMAMTNRDVQRAEKLQNQAWVGLEPEIRQSLASNVESRSKADIETLIAGNFRYLTSHFLPKKLDEVLHNR